MSMLSKSAQPPTPTERQIQKTHHCTCLMLRNPSNTSASELTWCRLSRTMTVGSSSLAVLCSHWSTTFDRYWRSSLLDLRSTLNVAMLPAAGEPPDSVDPPPALSVLQLNTSPRTLLHTWCQQQQILTRVVNKKFDLTVTRRAAAYISSCSSCHGLWVASP